MRSPSRQNVIKNSNNMKDCTTTEIINSAISSTHASPSSASTLPLARQILVRVIMALPDLACVLDKQGNILFGNQSFEKILFRETDITVESITNITSPNPPTPFISLVPSSSRDLVASLISRCTAERRGGDGPSIEEYSISFQIKNIEQTSYWQFTSLTGVDGQDLVLASGRFLIARRNSLTTGLSDSSIASRSKKQIARSNSMLCKSPDNKNTNSTSLLSTLKLLSPLQNFLAPSMKHKIHVENSSSSDSNDENKCNNTIKNNNNMGIDMSNKSISSYSSLDYKTTLHLFGEKQMHTRKVQATKSHYMSKIESLHQETQNLHQTLEVKRIFVKHTAHEIRTPLNIVSSGLNLLQMEHPENECYQQVIHDMKLACTAAVDIVGDFITYEKIDANILKLDKIACDIVQVVRTAAQPFHVQAKAHHMHLIIENLLDKEYLVEVDECKVQQVLRNLVSNALKFSKTPQSVVLIRIKLAEQDNSKQDLVRIEVIDQGAGISACNQKKLFSDIVQFNSRELQGGGGSGIGLWVSAKLMTAHGGAIGVFSAGEGHGSTFYLDFPVAQMLTTAVNNMPSIATSTLTSKDSTLLEPQSTSTIFKQSIKQCTNKQSTNRPPRILLVDDSITSRKMTAKLFSKFGAIVKEVHDGHACLQEIVQSNLNNNIGPYDAIVMDAYMGEMSGISTTRFLREKSFSGKIFGLTGDCSSELMQNFHMAGADQVFVKPLSVDNLNTILKLLS